MEMTVKQASEYLKISERSVWRMVREGKWETVKKRENKRGSETLYIKMSVNSYTPTNDNGTILDETNNSINYLMTDKIPMTDNLAMIAKVPMTDKLAIIAMPDNALMTDKADIKDKVESNVLLNNQIGANMHITEPLIISKKLEPNLVFIGKAIVPSKEKDTKALTSTEIPIKEIMNITDEFIENALDVKTHNPIREERTTQIDPSKLKWDKARAEDKERAWLKWEIIQAFIKYRIEYN